MSEIEKVINDAWENKDRINQNSEKSILNSINQDIAKPTLIKKTLLFKMICGKVKRIIICTKI